MTRCIGGPLDGQEVELVPETHHVEARNLRRADGSVEPGPFRYNLRDGVLIYVPLEN